MSDETNGHEGVEDQGVGGTDVYPDAEFTTGAGLGEHDDDPWLGGLPDDGETEVEVDVSIPRLTVAEFRDAGFLQEANRLFFHPRGLALEVSEQTDEDVVFFTGAVWDYRDDPEGVVYGPGIIDPDKIARVADERRRHVDARKELFGSEVQPPE